MGKPPWSRLQKPPGKESDCERKAFRARARELNELYSALKVHDVGINDRLQVLLHVKWTVKEFPSKLSKEIASLVDREADMLDRGRPTDSVNGLRSRLENLFLRFIMTPEYNPEAKRIQRVPSSVAMKLNPRRNIRR